ncbi:MAG: ABC transporter ATP-binding protein [Dehalococcoidia bacterium]|jgi:tungstate transport system ATP-binding protein
MVPIIETKNLSQIYEGRQILKDVNFSLEKDDALALIGPNGAGKTTLLRLLDLLEKPSSGQIYFDAVDVTRSGKSRLRARRRMAFIHQKPIMFKMNAFNNVACGLKFRREDKKNVRNKVEQVLELVDMNDYRKRDARTLSGGEMQRIAIARALVTNPAVLFLDEPTANLDPASVSKVEEILARIMREGKTAILMVTHDMAQGQRIARKIGVLINGDIPQIGSPSDIFFAPTSTRVAEFVGVENILPGTVAGKEHELAIINVNGVNIQAITDLAQGENVHVMIRPEDITFTKTRDSSSARNVFEGRINKIIPLGPLTRIEIDCGMPLLGVITTRSASELELTISSKLFASFKATAIHVIKRV